MTDRSTDTNNSMATYSRINGVDTTKLLVGLSNEEEFIVKPFHSEINHKTGNFESGRIVSRINKTLFDYQIGKTTNSSKFSALFHRRIAILDPHTKEVILEYHHNRLSPIFKLCCKPNVRCVAYQSHESSSIGAIHKRLIFGKILYDIYDEKHDRAAGLALRKSYIRRKLQNHVPEFLIMDSDETKLIGQICPFSTDVQRSKYRNAVSTRLPRDMKVETKATLLICTLLIKSHLE